jgi:hypothetical protein
MKQRLKQPRREGTQKQQGKTEERKKRKRKRKRKRIDTEKDHTTMTTKRLCNSLQLKSIST